MESRLETEKLRWETSFRDWEHLVRRIQYVMYTVYLLSRMIIGYNL